MTLENLLLSVCEEMSKDLSENQMLHLRDTLFIKFHGMELREECTALQPAMEAEEQNLIDIFRASKMICGRQQSTINQYEREIKALRNACGKRLTEINSVDLRWYFGMCRAKRNNGMTTILSKKRYLNSFYDFLFKEGIISKNPLEKIETMKVEKRLKKAFTTDNLERLRVACSNNYRNRAMMEFLLSTGVRISECCSLDVKDIDFTRQEFMVIGKGNKQRKCYINDTGSFYLLRYLDQRMHRENLTAEELKERPLFTASVYPYGRMTKRCAEKILADLGRKANVEDVHPHRFRRTYASSMASRGCPLQDLKVLMGHSRIETTMAYCDIKEENINMSYRKYGEPA